MLTKARKEGLLATEQDVEDPAKSAPFSKYPTIMADHHMIEFITDCLRLMVSGNLDPHELETHHKEAALFDYFKNPSMQAAKASKPAPGQAGPGGASTSPINLRGGLDAPRSARKPDVGLGAPGDVAHS